EGTALHKSARYAGHTIPIHFFGRRLKRFYSTTRDRYVHLDRTYTVSHSHRALEYYLRISSYVDPTSYYNASTAFAPYSRATPTPSPRTTHAETAKCRARCRDPSRGTPR